ncbi:hypothetical protein XH91_02510 [Bradyrhizobium guangzhouense]|uniref:Uncharacterized protein n=1 Tax=Bradyrhizobium guangzhouense TaxID=1325095 RepID=A0AAE5WWD9_9BRAD|nr:hypothetical protein XH91_02510 [Bradyrhizobium guangzhouense]
MGAFISEDGGPGKARKGKIGGLFCHPHQNPSSDSRALSAPSPLVGEGQGGGCHTGILSVAPRRRQPTPFAVLPPLPNPPPQGGRERTFFRVRVSFPSCLKKRVGPPDAVNTGGPVPLQSKCWPGRAASQACLTRRLDPSVRLPRRNAIRSLT